MSVKDKYIKGISLVVDGKMTKEELFELFEEHLTEKNNEISLLSKALEDERNKYHHLLSEVSKAASEHKKIYG